MFVQTSFRVYYGLVIILDQLAKKYGSKNFASYLSSKPRSGISILKLYTELIPNNGSASLLDVSVDKSVTEMMANDPQQITQHLNKLPANYDELPSDYDGLTVEVKLERSFSGHKTIKVTIPAAK